MNTSTQQISQQQKKTTTTTPSATMADINNFKNTPYYQASNIEALQQRAAGYATDDETLRKQAEALYNPTYQTNLEALRHQTEQQVQGYENQIAGIGTAYDQERRRLNEGYDTSAVKLDNALTRRGLGRSSLVSTQGAYLENKRNQALGDIDAQQAAAINALNEKVALIRDQAAQQERTLANQYATQLESRVNELREKNQAAAAQLELNIASMQQQGYQAYQDWLLKNRAQTSSEEEAAFQRELAEKQHALQQAQFDWNKELGGKQEERMNRQLEQSILDSNRTYELNRNNQEFNQNINRQKLAQDILESNRNYEMQRGAQEFNQGITREQLELSKQNQNFNQSLAEKQYNQSVLDSNRNYQAKMDEMKFNQGITSKQLAQSILDSNRNYELQKGNTEFQQNLSTQQLAQSILDSNRNYELQKGNTEFQQNLSTKQLEQSILDSNRTHELNERNMALKEKELNWKMNNSGGSRGGSGGRSGGGSGSGGTPTAPTSDDIANDLDEMFKGTNNTSPANGNNPAGTGTNTFNNLVNSIINNVNKGTDTAKKYVLENAKPSTTDDPNIPGALTGTHSANGEQKQTTKTVTTNADKAKNTNAKQKQQAREKTTNFFTNLFKK